MVSNPEVTGRKAQYRRRFIEAYDVDRILQPDLMHFPQNNLFFQPKGRK